MAGLNLRQVDRLEVQIIVDNYTDLTMGDTEVVKRANVTLPDVPLAEHGLSCLLRVGAGSEEHTVMMDTGITGVSIIHNMAVLGVDPDKVECLVLSHGHIDHYGGIPAFLDKARKGIPIVLHPDVFTERRYVHPDKGPNKPHILNEKLLNEKGAEVRKIRAASTIASGTILVTGEVERVTDFEKGTPWSKVRIGDEWVVDPFLHDQGLAIDVKGKGLVVLGGCSHAGIINTVLHAKKVTGIERVHAVLGGFHLNGPPFEQIIGVTIEEMKKIKPDIVVPMHCTGWEAINRFSKEMPGQFILNNVGSTYFF